MECKSALQRAVALNPIPDNLLDHLGVAAAILDIPLIVCEEKTFELAQLLYPQVKTIFKNSKELTLEYLAENYDFLFLSSKRWAIELFPLFPLMCQKEMRVVYCPHGNSDKGHTLTEESHAPEDIALVYGNHMVDLLKDTGMYEKIRKTIPTGNYRYSFYREHRSFYQNAALERLRGKLDFKRKTIFYAPTWQNNENPSSFWGECEKLIRQIASPFNLMIKLHPYLFEQQPAQVISIVERYRDFPNIVFLEEFPPIYPLLDLADVYLGDFSSIGYDFLSFDKPMYFFNPGKSKLEKDRGRFLHRCGMEVPDDQNVFEWIEKTIEFNQMEYGPIRKQIYEYAFGADRTLSEISLNLRSQFSNLLANRNA